MDPGTCLIAIRVYIKGVSLLRAKFRYFCVGRVVSSIPLNFEFKFQCQRVSIFRSARVFRFPGFGG